MVEFIRDENLLANATELDQSKLKALNDQTRLEILKILSETPSYPSEIAEKLGISKQKAYYHFEKLKDAGLLEKDHQEKRSGGLATYYKTPHSGLILDLEGKSEKVFVPERTGSLRNFLSPLVENGQLSGNIVVGSPDQHGPDQVRARDGHLAAELTMKLGGYASRDRDIVVLDTEVVRDSMFETSLLLLGGVLTNTVMKKFNPEFSAKFSGESFPYHEIKTPESSFTDENIGLIAKTKNPQNPDKSIYAVAGIRNAGTRAAVKAFKDLENLVEGYTDGDFYTIIRGLDMDGDGQIDDYEILETSLEDKKQ
jgi:DNA-binding transcriptional ArsR family regulator